MDATMVLPANCYRPEGYLEFGCPKIISKVFDCLSFTIFETIQAIGNLFKRQQSTQDARDSPISRSDSSVGLPPSTLPSIKPSHTPPTPPTPLTRDEEAILEQVLMDFARSSRESVRTINGERIEKMAEVTYEVFKDTLAKISGASFTSYESKLANYMGPFTGFCRKTFHYTVETLLKTFNQDISKTIFALNFLTQTAFATCTRPGALSTCFTDLPDEPEFSEQSSQTYCLTTAEPLHALMSITCTKTKVSENKAFTKTRTVELRAIFSPENRAPLIENSVSPSS